MTKTVLRLVVLSLCLVGLAARPAAADDLADARAAIGKQVDALKQGNDAVVRKLFTARLRDKITPEAIKAAQQQLGSMTLDDLVASVAPGSGKDSLKDDARQGRRPVARRHHLVQVSREDARLTAR